MTERVESVEELRAALMEELKNRIVRALVKIETWVAKGQFDVAIGGLDTVKFVLEAVKEWNK